MAERNLLVVLLEEGQESRLRQANAQRSEGDANVHVGGADQDGGLDRSLRQFGLPVTRLPASAPVRPRNPLREAIRGLARGRSKVTPFALFSLVNLTLLALA